MQKKFKHMLKNLNFLFLQFTLFFLNSIHLKICNTFIQKFFYETIFDKTFKAEFVTKKNLKRFYIYFKIKNKMISKKIIFLVIKNLNFLFLQCKLFFQN